MKIYKISQDKRQIILQAAQFVLDMVQKAISQNPQTPDQLTDIIRSISRQQGLYKGNTILIPKNIDPESQYGIKVYPKSSDGKTYAGAWGKYILLYADVIMNNKTVISQGLYPTLIHEFAHLFEQEGTSPDEDIENARERTVRYLTNEGEMNSFAWQISAIYNQMFPNQPFDNTKLSQLAQQSTDNRIQAYLIKFTTPEIQQEFAHITNLDQVHTTMMGKIQYYVNYILQQNQIQSQQQEQPKPLA